MSMKKTPQSETVVAEAEKEVREHTAQVLEAEEVLTGEVADTSEATPAEVSSSTEIAAAPANTAIATKQISAALEEEGFAELQLDYYSFKSVKLQQEFETSDGENLPSEGFTGLLLGSRKKWAVTSLHTKDDEREAEFVYNLGEIQNPNSKAYQAIQRWKEQGVDYITKDYKDVFFQILDDGRGEREDSLNGELVILSIPQTSIGKLDGYLLRMNMKYRTPIKHIVTRVSRGKKVTEAVKAFYPWKFDFVRKATEEEIAG